VNENNEDRSQQIALPTGRIPKQQSTLQRIADTLSDPDSALALSIAALIPLIRRSKKWAGRHPLLAAGVLGAMAISFFMKQKQEWEDRTLH
jgi:hypothetical protein